MSEEVLTKETVKKLMATKAETRGVNLTNAAVFVAKKKGKEGVRKIEEALEEFGFPLEFGRVKTMDFYPAGYLPVIFLLMKQLFNWGDEDLRELCGFAVTSSLVVRVYMKFFHSAPQMAQKAPEIWREYFNVGELEVVDYDLEKKYAIFEIRNFDLHKTFCTCVEGYLKNIMKLLLNPRKIFSQEVKCTFKGQSSHRFRVTWK